MRYYRESAAEGNLEDSNRSRGLLSNGAYGESVTQPIEPIKRILTNRSLSRELADAKGCLSTYWNLNTDYIQPLTRA